MSTWRFTGYYSRRCERAKYWNWRCSVDGTAKIISLRLFTSFAECVRDAETYGYQHGEHRPDFERRFMGSAMLLARGRGRSGTL